MTDPQKVDAEALREARIERLRDLNDEKAEEESTAAISKSASSDPPERGDISDLPQQLEQEIRLLIRRTSGYIETEVYADETFVDITFNTGFEDGR